MKPVVEPAPVTLPEPLPADAVVGRLGWRYATKKFDPTKKITPADWAALERSLVLAPSSYGLQPWRFLVIDDPAVRERLVGASWGQRQVADASHLVVFLARLDLTQDDVHRYLSRIAHVRGVSHESLAGLRKMLHKSIDALTPEQRADWNARQAYIALGHFMAASALMGIDTCPMEGFEPEQYDRILNLSAEGYRAVLVCPAGYRAADDRAAEIPKVRFAHEDLIKHI